MCFIKYTKNGLTRHASTLSIPLTPVCLVVDENLKVVGVIFYVVGESAYP
jgi:hypothetical protein